MLHYQVVSILRSSILPTKQGKDDEYLNIWRPVPSKTHEQHHLEHFINPTNYSSNHKMKPPETGDQISFTHTFENPHGPHDWVTDREKLLRKLLSLGDQLTAHPTNYRPISRSLMKYAHALDTLVKGGGLLESAMSGTDIPACFVERCDVIRDELVGLSRMLIDAPVDREYVCMGVECLCVQIGRLSLRVDGADDPDAEIRDLMVNQTWGEVLERCARRCEDVRSMWERFRGVWICLESAFMGCGCCQCRRRLLGGRS